VINLNRFDLATLRLFIAVVDAGSLTAGADVFGPLADKPSSSSCRCCRGGSRPRQR
jgi:hypothetical protein